MVKSNFNFNLSNLIGARPTVLKTLRKRFVIDQAFAWKWTKSFAISNIIAVLAILDRWRYSKRSGTITIDQPPVFIIGHWRSGTTLLHNLMTLDSKAAYPTTFQNVFPNNLFAFQKVIKWCMKVFLPATRPGDGLPLHVDQPQEEEFAIGNEIGISFYNWMFFPRDATYFRETFLEGKLLTKEIEIAWKKNYVQFVKRTLLNSGGKTFVSKNPPNTARIPWLLDLFPNAKFIFIHRNPYDVYCSTIKFFTDVIKPLQFQQYTETELKEHVLASYVHLHEAYFRDAVLIPSDNLIELPYDQVVQGPLSVIEKIASKFGFPNLDGIQDQLKQEDSKARKHRIDTYTLESSQINEINMRWGVIFERLGYPKRE